MSMQTSLRSKGNISDKRILIDIFINQNDVTSLRWLQELIGQISPYSEFIILNTHHISRAEAKLMQIKCDSIHLNEKEVQFHEVEQILCKMASLFQKS